jgi:pimeloyl-ACP methyl ester carboxylesterase
VEIGSQDLVNRLKKQSQACPNQTFTLVGYSQGGRVIGLAAPNIPDSIQGKIVAVVLYGAATGKGLPQAMKSKLLSNCAPGDFVS